MTPRRLLLAALLTATTAFGQLLSPEPDRLTDYLNWFDGFNPVAGAIIPALNTPDGLQADTPHRDWSGWARNAPVGLTGPIVGATQDLNCEVVFLGHTGSDWRAFGYRQSGIEYLLSDDLGGVPFGSYILPPLTYLETLDFYIERTDGTRYYAFDKSLNTAPAMHGFFGTVTPLTTCRPDDLLCNEDSALPFALLAFVPEYNGTTPPEAFLFALRAGYDSPAAVPEPATFGLAAAALLAALGIHRRRAARPTAA
jgi:hypothetical protein